MISLRRISFSKSREGGREFRGLLNTISRLAVAAFCYSFVPLVPYCYVRIYRFRKNQKKLGLPERETKYRENLYSLVLI